MVQPFTLMLILALVQTPSLDSSSPRERRDAVESMAVLGNRDAVTPLGEAYRREPSRPDPRPVSDSDSQRRAAHRFPEGSSPAGH
jgi:hypothetical protein